MIIVTGGAGFIGSNIVKELNRRGRTDILIVDDLKDGENYKNLRGLQFIDYQHKDDFLQSIEEDDFDGTDIDAITVTERGVETGAVFTLTKAF